ncbi:MAG: VC0807 family protein [Caulobacteraceae bacterium]
MTETAVSSRAAQAKAWILGQGPKVAPELLFNFILPFLIYDLGKARLGDVHALMASSGPPIAWSLFEFARRRRIDAVSILVLVGIALGLLAFLGGGGVKFLQLREHLVGGLIALAFLFSAAIKRPIIYYLAVATMRRRGSADLAGFEARRNNPGFRRALTTMTLVWGVGLLASTTVACALVFAVSIKTYLIISPIIGYSTAGVLAGWTWLYARARRRRGAAMEAAAAARIAAERAGEGEAERKENRG